VPVGLGQRPAVRRYSPALWPGTVARHHALQVVFYYAVPLGVFLGAGL